MSMNCNSPIQLDATFDKPGNRRTFNLIVRWCARLRREDFDSLVACVLMARADDEAPVKLPVERQADPWWHRGEAPAYPEREHGEGT